MDDGLRFAIREGRASLARALLLQSSRLTGSDNILTAAIKGII